MFDSGYGGSGLLHVFGAIVWIVGTLVTLAVIAGVIVLLVRFLLIGTKAAQLYVAQNGPAPRPPSPSPTPPAQDVGPRAGTEDAPAGPADTTPTSSPSAVRVAYGTADVRPQDDPAAEPASAASDSPAEPSTASASPASEPDADLATDEGSAVVDGPDEIEPDVEAPIADGADVPSPAATDNDGPAAVTPADAPVKPPARKPRTAPRAATGTPAAGAIAPRTPPRPRTPKTPPGSVDG